MSPAEDLAAAAGLLRTRARHARESMAALPGPPYPTVDAFHLALCRQFPISRGMAEHIAGWTPELADAFAALLDAMAAEIRRLAGGLTEAELAKYDPMAPTWLPALAVARTITAPLPPSS